MRQDVQLWDSICTQWAFFAHAPVHLCMCSLNCVLSRWANRHRMLWSASLYVMVAVNSFCSHSRCTAVEQMWCILDRGMFSRYLSTHTYLLITILSSNKARWGKFGLLCGSAAVTKLSHLFRDRWRKEGYLWSLLSEFTCVQGIFSQLQRLQIKDKMTPLWSGKLHM